MGRYPRLAIVLAGPRVFRLGVLVFFLTLPCDSGVGAVTFGFSGFHEESLYAVPGSVVQSFDSGTSCFALNKAQLSARSSRFLFRDAVQMKGPDSTTVQSFSTSFIYKIESINPLSSSGPGMAFIIVPTNDTIGSAGDYLGLMSSDDSDKNTFGVELDTFMNSEFNDADSNHIGINLASMKSTYSFPPTYNLVSGKYQQIWIDYSQDNSSMDIYITDYKPKGSKPDKPQYSTDPLNLSLLRERMFVGFSSASYGMNFSDIPYLCAWSFSNDGSPAPPIVFAQDVGNERNLWIVVGVPVLLIVSVGMIICSIVSLCWCQFVSRPLRIFLSHAGGPDGSQKNFPTWLDERMRTWAWSVAKSRVRIFFDKEGVEMGRPIPEEILRELASFDVGVVVVTDAFFKKKWPMTELIAFVEAQMNDPTERIRVLPLFYELSPEQVRAHLDGKTWEEKWEEMSKEGGHPLLVEKCREAVTWLCQQRGILYDYEKRDHDIEYIETICKEVDKILCKERNFKSYLLGNIKTYCVPSCFKSGMTVHETETLPLLSSATMASGSNT